MATKTITTKPKPISDKLSAIGLSAVDLTAGMTGDYYVTKDIQLADRQVTAYEYSVYKPEILQRFDDRYNAKQGLTLNERDAWMSVAGKEAEECNGFQIVDANAGNTVLKIQELLKDGRCK